MILVLFILPTDKTNWIQVTNNELIAQKCAYWYFPGNNSVMTENSATKRITIDKRNNISHETINQLFEKFS